MNNLPILHTASGNSVAQSIHAHIANSDPSEILAFKMEKKIPEFNLQPDLHQEESKEDLMATTPTSPALTPSDPPKKQYRVQCTNQKCSDCNKIAIDDTENKISMNYITNLTKDQRDFLHLHERWDHMSFDLLKRLAHHGLIEKRFAKVDPPFCLSCKLGKAHQLSRNKSNSIISESVTKPGDLIHTDQAESATPGRPMTISGYNNKTKISVFTLFIDSISKKIFVEFQSSTDAKQTLVGKHRLEHAAAEYNVTVKHYRADNGVFKSKEFELDIQKNNKRISYSGVGAK